MRGMVIHKQITMPLELVQEWDAYKTQATGANLSRLLTELLTAYLRKEPLDGHLDKTPCE